MTDPRLTPERIEELREYVSDDYTSPLGASERRGTILALLNEREISDGRVQSLWESLELRTMIRGDTADDDPDRRPSCGEVLAIIRRLADAENERDTLRGENEVLTETLKHREYELHTGYADFQQGCGERAASCTGGRRMTAVFSAEYAASLVQASREGMIFEPRCYDFYGLNGDDHVCRFPDGDATEYEYAAREAEYLARISVPSPYHFWEPKVPIVGNSWEDSYDPTKEHGGYWVAWYRETDAAESQARSLMRSTWSNGEYRWGEAWADLALVKTGFRNAVDDLGWLIQLPDEWTDAHHEVAHEIGRKP